MCRKMGSLFPAIASPGDGQGDGSETESGRACPPAQIPFRSTGIEEKWEEVGGVDLSRVHTVAQRASVGKLDASIALPCVARPF